MEKIGTQLVETEYGFELISGKSELEPKNLSFETYNDHRIAMSFAPLFLQYGSVTINDPKTVNKSYPLFWENIQQLGLAVVEKI